MKPVDTSLADKRATKAAAKRDEFYRVWNDMEAILDGARKKAAQLEALAGEYEALAGSVSDADLTGKYDYMDVYLINADLRCKINAL